MEKMNDINDDEIRILGSSDNDADFHGFTAPKVRYRRVTYDNDEQQPEPAAEPQSPPVEQPKPRSRGRMGWWLAALLLVVVAGLCFLLLRRTSEPAPPQREYITVNRVVLDTLRAATPEPSYVEVTDTVINHIPLQIFKPVEAVPELVLGNLSPADTSIVLAAMAADFGETNGELQVVGAFVYRGEILSKSKSKQGFCALLGDTMIIGKALTTPYFEQCVTEDGDFFRQFALVSDGQDVAPVRKQRSVHRALCLKGGDYYVIDSQTAVTNTQFAQALCALQVEQAISLMGSAYAVRWACDKSGRRYETGDIDAQHPDVASFLVWRKK